jgi:thiol-disulfide isomerase/thioredoxin
MNKQFRRGAAAKAWLAVVLAIAFCVACVSILNALVSKRTNQPLPGRGDAFGSMSDMKPVVGTFGDLTFSGMNGAPVAMADFLGRPLLVEIWATWCGPCVKARKVLHGLADEADAYAHLIALSVDRGGTDVVSRFLENKNEPPSPWLDLMADDPKFRGVIGPHDTQSTIPKLIFVSAEGRVVDIEYGIPNPKWVLNRLKALASVRAPG